MEYFLSLDHWSCPLIWIFAIWILRATQPDIRGVTIAAQLSGPLAVSEHSGGKLWKMTHWLHLCPLASA